MSLPDWSDYTSPRVRRQTVLAAEGFARVAPDVLLVKVQGVSGTTIGWVAPGVRLVMGDVPGRAQAASEGVEFSMVFARALEGRPDENGLLWALIILQ